jgi:response regulator of citrate/malate metabolism
MTNKKVNVLLVDDSQKIISKVTSLLSGVAQIDRIECAGGVPEAQKIMQTFKTDVVVLDISLAGGNGIDLLKWIKFHYPETRVVMFSNNADKVHRAISVEYGAEHFLDKTTEFEQLPEILIGYSLQ